MQPSKSPRNHSRLRAALLTAVATVGVAVGGGLVHLYGEVREHSTAIKTLQAHDAEQETARVQARQTLTAFLREYERKEAEDQLINDEVRALADQVAELRLLVAREHGE